MFRKYKMKYVLQKEMINTENFVKGFRTFIEHKIAIISTKICTKLYYIFKV